MELSDLRIFKAVVEAGGVNAAARRLHRVPSNVTTRIRQLEADLGTDLFLRRGQRLVLSTRGHALLDYAGRLLALADEARTAASDDVAVGGLKLGALESTTASRLPPLLARLHRDRPGLRLELQTGTNDALTRAVLERQVDIAFVVERPLDQRLDSVTAFPERLVLITPAAAPPVRMPAEIESLAVLAFPVGCAYRRRLERWLGERRLPSLRVIDVASYHAIVACVAAGIGIAVVPESILAVVDHSEIRIERLPTAIAEAQTHLVWRRGELSPAGMALRDSLDDPGATG